MKYLQLLIVFLLISSYSFAQFPDPDPTMELELVANGFDSPVDITHAGDDRVFIVEQDGIIRIMNADYSTELIPFLNISSSVSSGGERGLLGLAFDPNYDSNGHFFVHYTKSGGDSRLSRFTVSSDPNIADAASELIILEQSQPFSNHNAGDIAFGPDGYLYIPFGDGGSGGDPQDNGQDGTTWLGNMLRIDVSNAMVGDTYDIPADNPFIGDPTVLDESWAIGLRNTWRISFDALTGDLYMADVGQNSWEEIDFESAGFEGGNNYGWRCYEGNHVYNTSNCGDTPVDSLTFPVFEYSHSGGACSVTGGFVYRGSEFPNLNGLYIFTDYCNGIFRGIKRVDGSWLDYQLTGALGFGWTTFGQNSQRELFVGKNNGEIYKITDPCAGTAVEVTLSDGLLTADPAESYLWMVDGVIMVDETNQSIGAVEGSVYQVQATFSDGCSAISNPFEVPDTCPADVVEDGVINILDIVAISSNFGCTEDCPIDTNGDGLVNILDLIAVSSSFGNPCP